MPIPMPPIRRGTGSMKRTERSGCCPTGWAAITEFFWRRERPLAVSRGEAEGEGAPGRGLAWALELNAPRQARAIQLAARAGDEIPAQVEVHRVATMGELVTQDHVEGHAGEGRAFRALSEG